MSIFQELENNLYFLGILNWGSSNKTKFITIIINCVVVTISVSYVISNTWFLLFEAQTPDERIDGFNFALSSLLLCAWYLNFIWNRNQYTAIMIDLAKIVETSKCE